MGGGKMASSPPNRLTPLQRELLEGFFDRRSDFYLTGGGALAGYYLGHRQTEDLDLFSGPGPDLADAARTMTDVAQDLGASVATRSAHGDFRRLMVTRGDEECVVDLVIDRASVIDPHKPVVGTVRLDTLREIAANKICTLVSRSEIKDLVDLRGLLEAGIDLSQAFHDAQRKEGSAEPATLAWVLDQLVIGPTARLPGDVDPAELDAFRKAFVRRLRSDAYDMARTLGGESGEEH
jgi:hypothetical protein